MDVRRLELPAQYNGLSLFVSVAGVAGEIRRLWRDKEHCPVINRLQGRAQAALG